MLTPEQLQKLQANCNTMPMAQLKKYFESGLISSTAQLPQLNDDRRRELDKILATFPNPEEKKGWLRVQSALNSGADPQSALNLLDDYIRFWEEIRPSGNHVDEALRLRLTYVEKQREATARIEEADRAEILNHPAPSPQMITAYLGKHPYSAHIPEMDTPLWEALMRQGDAIEGARVYLRYFPAGVHKYQASQVSDAIDGWEEVRDYGDIFKTREYILNFPGSPLINNAFSFMSELKEIELEAMADDKNPYDYDRLVQLVDNGIFSEPELCARGILRPGDIDYIRSISDQRDMLPDINTEIRRCKAEIKENATDVYFFGIPSTGKSCILMGLIGSSRMHYNSVRGAGSYADALSQYLMVGATIGRTPGDFIATIHADIQAGNKSHPVNLVEMSGEEFAFILANNEQGKVSFAEMGKGAPELLRNNNRKIFFIIVDPTASVLKFQHAVPLLDEKGLPVINEEGYIVNELREYYLNQRIMLRKMIDTLMDPDNRDVMKRVDAIHFIVTKADTLDNNPNGNSREAEAMARFNQNFPHEIDRLTSFCIQHDINSTNNKATNGHPRLYTFSLGNFITGGIFKFVPDDADKLVEVIMENTASVRENSLSDKIRGIFNKSAF
ncbi:MAG: hypothetical protein NC328_02070 [Muribaculum sp.]|nr:hypothetical protein [Muribaculum sp.]